MVRIGFQQVKSRELVVTEICRGIVIGLGEVIGGFCDGSLHNVSLARLDHKNRVVSGIILFSLYRLIGFLCLSAKSDGDLSRFILGSRNRLIGNDGFGGGDIPGIDGADGFIVRRFLIQTCLAFSLQLCLAFGFTFSLLLPALVQASLEPWDKAKQRTRLFDGAVKHEGGQYQTRSNQEQHKARYVEVGDEQLGKLIAMLATQIDEVRLQSGAEQRIKDVAHRTEEQRQPDHHERCAHERAQQTWDRPRSHQSLSESEQQDDEEQYRQAEPAIDAPFRREGAKCSDPVVHVVVRKEYLVPAQVFQDGLVVFAGDDERQESDAQQCCKQHNK